MTDNKSPTEYPFKLIGNQTQLPNSIIEIRSKTIDFHIIQAFRDMSFPVIESITVSEYLKYDDNNYKWIELLTITL